MASAMQGLSLAPEPDRKPSADEKDERDSKPSADDEDRKKRAATAEYESGGNECVVCLDAPNAVVLVPCGHKCLCETCAERILVGEPCPVCRVVVAVKWANGAIY